MKQLPIIILCMLLLCSCGDTPANDSEFSAANGQEITNDNRETTNNSTDTDSDSEAEASSSSTLVAEPLSSLEINPDCAKAMNPVHYFGENAVFKKAWADNGRWGFGGNKATYEAVKAYVDLLTTQYDFQPVAEPHEEVLEKRNYTKTYFEYTLSYVGSYYLESNPEEGDYTSHKGDIVITGTLDVLSDDPEGDIDFDVRCNENLKVLDEGYRYGGEKLINYYCGDSFGCGLLLNPDGTFETTDNRFKVAVGETMLITDGTASSHTSQFNLNFNSNIQEFVISNPLGICQLSFSFPITRTLTSGTIYGEADLFTDNTLQKPYENMTETKPDLRDGGFHILHNERYYMPQQGMLADFKQLNMRILYVAPDYSVAVIYFCADFSTAPNRTEGLIAVQLNASNGNTATGSEKVYNMRVGETLEIKGPEKFGSAYNLYTWSFTGGSEFCEMHHTNLPTVSIIAHKPGTVRIKLQHEYTEERYDSVLKTTTKDMKSATKTYVIYISE